MFNLKDRFYRNPFVSLWVFLICLIYVIVMLSMLFTSKASASRESPVMFQYVDVVYINQNADVVGYRFTDMMERRVCYITALDELVCFSSRVASPKVKDGIEYDGE
jgi:hypothetical protein